MLLGRRSGALCSMWAGLRRERLCSPSLLTNVKNLPSSPPNELNPNGQPPTPKMRMAKRCARHEIASSASRLAVSFDPYVDPPTAAARAPMSFAEIPVVI